MLSLMHYQYSPPPAYGCPVSSPARIRRGSGKLPLFFLLQRQPATAALVARVCYVPLGGAKLGAGFLVGAAGCGRPRATPLPVP